MSENPFQAPQSVDPSTPAGTTLYQHDGSGRAYVRQIGVVSALMIVQGVLVLLFGLFCVGYAIFFVSMDEWVPAAQQARLDEELPQGQRQMITGVFFVWSAISIFLSIIYITAGVLNFGYRYRGWGIASLLIGLASALTCYCAISGVPLSIYGLIIYFNPAVATAFRLREQGLSKQDVLAQFVR